MSAALKFKFGTKIFAQAILYPDGYLTDVYTHPWARRRGYASKVMRAVCYYADTHNLVLDICVYKYANGGPSRRKLIEFYKRFGFEMCRSSERTMRRLPDSKAAYDKEYQKVIISLRDEKK